MTVHDLQELNRETIRYIVSVIQPGMSLTEVRNLCESYMLSHGADSFWYWDVGAFVFSGRETAISVSGREYRTSNTVLQDNDILTIDLSPQRNGVWGDYARTLILENGAVVTDPAKIQNPEWRDGLQMERKLHEAMMTFVTPKTTFEELYYYINGIIARDGYVNLDFSGNLGHSIVFDKNDRIYIEMGNKAPLSSAEAFTFEPHISLPGSFYGYKMENIYAFDRGCVCAL
ncbi:MAG: aminopeptidase P family protein [Clostridia bacterium]|nr:aminopeptidase P family protein [Clostridia bacterium]